MKKTFYVVCSMVLGLLLALIAHALIEMWVIKNLLVEGFVPVAAWSGRQSCYLPLAVNYGLFIVGAFAGYLVGLHWWQIVYVKKRHWGCCHWFKK